MFTWAGWCLASGIVLVQGRARRAVKMVHCACLKPADYRYWMHALWESFWVFTNLGAFCRITVVGFPPVSQAGDMLQGQTCSESGELPSCFGKVALVQRGWQPALTLALQRAELGQGLNESWGRLEKSALFFLINLPNSFSGNAADGNIAALSEG